MRVGKPGMKGKCGQFHKKCCHEQEHEETGMSRLICVPRSADVIERVDARLPAVHEVQAQIAEKHEKAAHLRKEEELD